MEGRGDEEGSVFLGEAEGRVTGNNGIFDEDGKRSLPSRGEIRLGRRPEVYLYPRDAESGRRLKKAGVLLRLATADHFEDQKWSSQIEVGKTYRPKDGVIELAQSAGEDEYEYDLYAVARGAGGRVLTAMPGTTQVALPYLRETAPARYRLPPVEEGRKFRSYRVKSAPQNAVDLMLREELLGLNMLAAAEVDPGYLQLPVDTELVSFLRKISGGGGRTLEAMIRIRKYLDDHYAYSLKLDNPDDHPALQNFLFHDKKGCCEHYATAATLLCRAAGIPARLAFGWRDGSYLSGQNFFLFRGRDAHAWTEVYLKDFGWVIFDTTPAADFGEEKIGGDEEVEVPDHPLAYEDEEGEAGNGLRDLIRWGWVVAGVCAGLMLAIFFLRSSRHDGGGEELMFAKLPKPPRYLEFYSRASAKLGCPLPRGMTLRQHLAKLEEKGMVPECAGELLEYHYAVLYREREQEPGKEREFLAELKKWAQRESSDQS